MFVLGKKSPRWVRDATPVIAIAALGIGMSIVSWHQMAATEQRTFVEDFYGRARNQAVILQSGVNGYLDKLYAVRALFDASNDKVTREEFETFAKSLLAGYPGLLNIAWVPRVKRGERTAHELAATRDGLPDYHIRTVAPDGRLPVEPERDEYLPKYYSTDLKTSPSYGMDMLEELPLTVEHIRDGDALSSSPPVMLHTGTGDRHGFWAGLPVYARGLPHESVSDRRTNWIGIVQAVFQFHDMIDSILGGLQTPVRLYFFKPDAGSNDLYIYSMSHSGVGPIVSRSQASLATGIHLSLPLNIGDVRWTMVVTPEPGAFVSSWRARSSIILISGILLSAGVAFAVWTWRRRTGDIEVANRKLEAALNNMVQGLLMYDAAGRMIITNRRFAEIYGMPWEKWSPACLGTTVAEGIKLADSLANVTTRNPTQLIGNIQDILKRGKPGAFVFERSDGRTYVSTNAPMSDGGYVVTLDDVTEARRVEEKISHLARYDALTDLPNRVLFYEKMEEFLSRARRGGAVAVLSLDLDHFKSVNDTLGHPTGDKLLQEAAERMRGCIRETDMAARLGGDEFAVVQSEIKQPADATALAARLIAAISAPYQIEGHEVIVGTSVGIAVAPSDGTEPDELMKNADLALYRCKADGGNTYRFFEAEMDARVQQRRALELDLRKALENGEFTLDYQPLIQLKSGKVSTCEALIRWRHPELGLMPPMDFIPIAEETNLIVPIGEWVLRRACLDAVAWPDEITVAVNVSPVQFKSGNFFQTVARALAESHLPANRLELEITELVLMQETNATRALLHRLKELGVSIAMDDFGTGYSSLGYLRSFPFNKIKIDQSFIRDVTKNNDSLAILRAVVGLGRSLGIVTTAEGVETNSQLDVLIKEGCTEAQGYFFSQPMSAAALLDFIESPGEEKRAIA